MSIILAPITDLSVCREREFFKLPRIRLTWESEGDKFVVNPFIEPSDTGASVGGLSVGSRDSVVPQPRMEAPQERREHSLLFGNGGNGKHTPHSMNPSPPPGNNQHQPLQPVEHNRQSLPPKGNPPVLPSNGLKATSTPDITKSSDGRSAHPPPRQSPGSMAHRPRESTVQASTASNLELDIIKRVQAQVSQSAATVATHERDIATLREEARSRDATLNQFMHLAHDNLKEIQRLTTENRRLSEETQAARQAQAAHTAEIYQLRTRPQSAFGAPTAGTEAALELMNHKLVEMSRKVGEVDALKVSLELLRSRLERLEGSRAAAPPAAVVPTVSSSAHTPTGEGVQFYHHRPTSHVNTPDPHETTEAAPSLLAASGWATVNAGVKRPHVESPSATPAVRSPKRPHLGETQTPIPSTQPAQHQPYEPRPVPHTQSFPSTMPATLPSQPTESSTPQSTLPSQHANGAIYSPYATQDAPPDESWRPESQRKATRGRPRKIRGAPKAISTYQTPYATPYEPRPEWPGVYGSQGTPSTPVPVPGTDYYSEPRARGIVRRGGGGAGPVTPAHPVGTGHILDVASQPYAGSPSTVGGTPGVVQYGFNPDGTPNFDTVYGQPKRTRTKPTRDENGVLIRKDGRPDRRSQSSALNLRRVHEAREREKAAASRPATPGPSTENPAVTEGLSDSVVKRHKDVMKDIFPNGIEAMTREQDWTQRAFGERGDHTAHPRTQHPTPKKANGQEKGTADASNRTSAAGEKKTGTKATVASDLQSPVPDEDVDMDRASEDSNGEKTGPGNGNGETNGTAKDKTRSYVSESPESDLSSVPPHEDSPVPDRVRNPYGLGAMSDSTSVT